jgi:hypothetical protein
MPVIFDNGSENIRTWLDPNRYEWSKELQSLLKPYDGELECYPVNRDVGKVGNNSPAFIIPIDSKENKSNIANFFANQKKATKSPEAKKTVEKAEEDTIEKGLKVEHESDETRITLDSQTSENNAPLPSSPRGLKRERSQDDGEIDHKVPKLSQEAPKPSMSPPKPARKTKSATSNGTKSSPKKQPPPGSQKITKFFGK